MPLDRFTISKIWQHGTLSIALLRLVPQQLVPMVFIEERIDMFTPFYLITKIQSVIIKPILFLSVIHLINIRQKISIVSIYPLFYGPNTRFHTFSDAQMLYEFNLSVIYAYKP